MNQLQARVHRFNEDHGWLRYHDQQNLVLAMCEELGELAKLVAWKRQCSVEELGFELADLLIYALSFASCIGLDADAIVTEKLAINATRFPR